MDLNIYMLNHFYVFHPPPQPIITHTYNDLKNHTSIQHLNPKPQLQNHPINTHPIRVTGWVIAHLNQIFIKDETTAHYIKNIDYSSLFDYSQLICKKDTKYNLYLKLQQEILIKNCKHESIWILQWRLSYYICSA